MLDCAADAVGKKELSIRRAAEAFGVSYGALWKRLNLGQNVKRGRPLHFKPDEEQQLVDLIVSCEKSGIALSKRILFAVVKNAAVTAGKITRKLFFSLFQSALQELRKRCCSCQTAEWFN